jgi:hypothetical protein
MLHFRKGCKTIIQSKINCIKLILIKKINLLRIWLNSNYNTYIAYLKAFNCNLNDKTCRIYSISFIDKICSYYIYIKNYGKRMILQFYPTYIFRQNTILRKVFCLRSHFT